MKSNGIASSLLLCCASIVITSASAEDSPNRDLMSTARRGFIEKILATAKASHIENTDSTEAALLIAFDKSQNVKTRTKALTSLTFADTAMMVPVEKIVNVLSDRNEDLSIRNRTLHIGAILMHQQENVVNLETTLFKILNSADNEEEFRLSCANMLLHFGSSTHALARNLSRVMTESNLSEQSIESFGMVLYGMSAYGRIRTDEAINWLISRHPPNKMTTEQKLKYFSIIGYLEDHSESSNGDHLDPQTLTDIQLYFESVFSNTRNPKRVRGFAATFIKNSDVLQPETIQAARSILADVTSPDSLKKDANRIVKLERAGAENTKQR